jgi:hypothetical protein
VNAPQESNNFNAHDVRIGPTILLQGGTYFDFLNPSESIFTIEDVAHGLSQICRFSGHTREFYSVAQHSLLVSLVVPEHLALQGLLHDASEAFIGDMVTPLKNILPSYREIESSVEATVLSRFGVSLPLNSAVKAADLTLLATEKRDLLPTCGGHWAMLDGVPVLPSPIVPVGPVQAKRMFLQRFYELFPL